MNNLKKRTEQYQDMIARFYPYSHDRQKETNKIQTANVTFQVTDDCCLQCTYCYQINKGHHAMPFEVAQKFIELLLANDENTQQYIDTRDSNAVIIEFIGGEPFMKVELMDQIMEYFIKRMIETNHPWQYNWRISISSNGVLYFEPKVQEFIKKWMNHLSFNISIDGSKELHDACRVFPDGSGSYDKAMAGVRHYIDVLGGVMGSKMTLAPANVMYTFDAVKGLIEQGYTEINLNCVFEKGWTEEHAIILYEQLKKLADYILENNLEDKVYIAMFEERFFHPKDKSDTQNWCWGAGTPILTTSGYKPIEELKIGDEVYTADGSIHPIINTMSHFANNCVNITTNISKDLICTENHKLFTTNGIKEIKDIYIERDIYNERDLIKTFIDGNFGYTDLINLTMAEPQMVYNITVDTNHSYIASGLVSSNCGGNGSMISVDWKGDIYPCIRYMESSLGTDVEPIIIGNVNDGIMTNAKCKACIQTLKSVNRINQSTEECIECPIAEGCAWCSAYNYQNAGDFFHRATYICIMHKARALANCYFWNLLYWKNGENKRFKLWLPDEECLKIISQEELTLLKALQYPIE